MSLLGAASIPEQRLRLVALLFAVPLAFALLILAARARDRIRGIARMIIEPPEAIHPVDLALFWSSFRHHLSPRTAYRAEIIHLARIGAISLIPIGPVSRPRDFLITYEREPEEQIDRDFMRFLFPRPAGEKGEVSLRSLRRTGAGGAMLGKWWGDSFDRMVLVVQRIWLDVRPEYLLAFAVGVLGTPLAVVTLAPDYGRLTALTLAVFFTGAIGWLLTAWALPPRLPNELRERVQRWMAFRRYLRRFPSLRDAPAAGIVIWERFLEDATALGVAGRVERQIRSLNATTQLPPPWDGAPPGTDGAFWLRHLWKEGPVHPPDEISQSWARATRSLSDEG